MDCRLTRRKQPELVIELGSIKGNGLGFRRLARGWRLPEPIKLVLPAGDRRLDVGAHIMACTCRDFGDVDLRTGRTRRHGTSLNAGSGGALRRGTWRRGQGLGTLGGSAGYAQQ